MSNPPSFLSIIMARSKEHKSGESVPESGIYSVVHDSNHHDPHDVTCVKYEHFPPCKCGKGAAFKLKYAAEHLSHHPMLKH